MQRDATASATVPYPRTRQWLHWVSAALILTMPVSGTLMARTADDGLRLNLYQAHLLVGWVVVGLMLVRVVQRVRRPVAPPEGLAPWNRALLGGVHWLITIVPLALAVSGSAAVLQNDLGPLLQAGTPPPATLAVTQARDAHQAGAYFFLALFVVHVAGVVRYQTTRGDALARMGLRGVPSGRRG